jgi:hypothetical protein
LTVYPQQSENDLSNTWLWKLHGWIDERIEDWKQAQGITGSIPWGIQWDKNMMPHHHHLVHTTDTAFMVTNTTNRGESEKMLEAVKIIKKAKIFPPFERIAGL